MTHRITRCIVSPSALLALTAMFFAPAASADTLFVDPMFEVTVTPNVHYSTAVDGNGNPVVPLVRLGRGLSP